jgi:hypothetical protein
MPQEPTHYVILFPAHLSAIVFYITNDSITLSPILLFAVRGTIVSGKLWVE